MNLLKISSLAVVLELFSMSSKASEPETVEVPLIKAFVPIGFDDNDRAQAMVTGILPDTCYRVGPYQTDIDVVKKTVSVRQMAYHYPGICLDVIIPFAQVTEWGMLKDGNYKVFDSVSGKMLGQMPINRAKVSEADDYLYAPVADAFIREAGGKHLLSLNGAFSTRCMKLKEVKIHYYPEVVVVQPIAEMLESRDCKTEKVRFQYEAPLKEGLNGTALLHVRSIDGQAINKLVEFP